MLEWALEICTAEKTTTELTVTEQSVFDRRTRAFEQCLCYTNARAVSCAASSVTLCATRLRELRRIRSLRNSGVMPPRRRRRRRRCTELTLRGMRTRASSAPLLVNAATANYANSWAGRLHAGVTYPHPPPSPPSRVAVAAAASRRMGRAPWRRRDAVPARLEQRAEHHQVHAPAARPRDARALRARARRTAARWRASRRRPRTASRRCSPSQNSAA